jgi:iron(III) transport system substrate-binding protein
MATTTTRCLYSRVIGLALVGLLLGACAASAAPSRQVAAAPAAASVAAPAPVLSGPLQELVQSARAEDGQVTLVSGPFYSSDNAPALIAEFEQGMQARYGIPFKITDTFGGSQPEHGTKLVAEMQSGRAPITDLYTGTDPDVVRLWHAGVLVPVDWSKYEPSLPQEALGPENTALAWQTQMKALVYNTNLVARDEVPRTLLDVLNPKWASRVASTPYASGFDIAGIFGVGDEYITDWLRQFARTSLAGLLRCSEFVRVANGEFAMLAVTCSNGDVRDLMAAGAPVDYVVLRDIPAISYSYVGIPKGAAHPNSTTLFALYLVSLEGQRLLWKYLSEDLDLIDGTNKQAIVKQKLLDQGIQPLRVSATQLAERTEDLARVKSKYQRILAGRE